MRTIIGDTETTGLGPLRKACEVALLEIDWDLSIIGEAESLINPGKPISEKAREIHGISDEDVKDKPTIEQWVEDTFGGQLDGDICLIGYRVGFDKPMLDPIGRIVKVFDVLPLAQSLVPEAPDHKLQTLKELFNLPGGPAHRAMGDVLTTHQLLRDVLLPRSGRDLRQHVHTDFVMIHKMPWGKHKGELLQNVPASYRLYLMSLDDLEPNLRKSLELLRTADLQMR